MLLTICFIFSILDTDQEGMHLSLLVCTMLLTLDTVSLVDDNIDCVVAIKIDSK